MAEQHTKLIEEAYETAFKEHFADFFKQVASGAALDEAASRYDRGIAILNMVKTAALQSKSVQNEEA